LANEVSLLSYLVNVYVPKDRVTNLHQGYGFVEFRSEEDADYVSL
jgi:splicing factor 3B subunit 4